MSGIRSTWLFFSLFLAVAACSGPRFALDNGAGRELSRLPGCIELKFSQKNQIWDISIEKGELKLRGIRTAPQGSLDEQYSALSQADFPDASLPVLDDYQYYGPHVASPDNSHEVFSIAYKTSWFFPTGFILVQQGTNRVVFQKKSRNIWSTVQDVAWSADSKMFAVLDMDTRRKNGVMESLSSCLGLPVEEGDFSLSVYDLAGHLLVKSRVASGLASPVGRMSWKN